MGKVWKRTIYTVFLLFFVNSCRSWSTFWDVVDRSAPDKLSFGSQSLIKLIPGVQVNFVPNITGTVKIWTLIPALPAGLIFNAGTGVISGAPTVSPFALTTYALTASNEFGSATYVFQLSILASGDNVWTVFSGTAGQPTNSTEGSLQFDATTNRLLVAGNTSGNLEGATHPGVGFVAPFVSAYTNSGSRVFTTILGGGTYNYATAAAGLRVDSSGTIYVTGTSYGDFEGNVMTPLTSRLYLAKLNSAGQKQWVKSHTSATVQFSVANNLSIDAAGNPIIAGYVKGNPYEGLTNNGGSDSALIFSKFNPSDGTITTSGLKSHTAGGTSRHVEAYASTFDSSGNYWVGGLSKSAAAGVCANPDLSFTPVVYKYDAALSYLLCGNSTVAGGTNNFVFGMVADQAGNIYSTGYANGTLDSIGITGVLDAFFIKYNSAGTRQFTRRLGVAAATTKAYSITRSTDDYYYITGETDGNLNGQTKNGTVDMFVAKYDNAGNLQWVKLMGSPGTTARGFGLTFDNNNTIYVAGVSNGNYDGVTNPAAPSDALMITRFVR